MINMLTLNNQDKYLVNQAQAFVRDTGFDISFTPDNKLSEGIDSVGRHMPAPWLPLIRYKETFKGHVVISSQKAVAHATDKNGNSFIVPAGYALAMEANDTSIVYTIVDVQNKVKNAEGNLVKAGESVIASMTAAGVKVSSFIGINNYDLLRHPGGDGINPNLYNFANYNPQANTSYNMRYAYEYPMVKDADYDSAPLQGIAAFIGEKAMAGQFVTYDMDSNFVLAEADGFGYGSTKPERIIGQISKVTLFRDPTTGKTVNTFNHLDKVMNYSLYKPEGLNVMPGTDNDGLISKLQYSNGFGLVAFTLQNR